VGDVSRHRDIFLFARDAVPTQVLGAVHLTRDDLTYLELGNYLTDVSQFRDPVTYIFAKRRIWRENVIPGTQERANPARIKAVLAALGVVAATQLGKELAEALDADTVADYTEGGGFVVGALLALAATLPADLLADLFHLDEWIDALLGTPVEALPPATTPAARKDRDLKHYGYLGEFFRLFIEGATQLLFAQDVQRRPGGPWGDVAPIPTQRLSEVYAEFYTQYYPHEHTDQPPYVWDASKRHLRPKLYGPSRRQAGLEDEVGVMNAVDDHYVAYLAEGLAGVEDDWRALRKDDVVGRQRLLVRTGKLLHGIEDWFFHSNVVELLELRAFRPIEPARDDDDLLIKFVNHVSKTRPEYLAKTGDEKRRLQRRLYRRLRFPVYDSATKEESAGRPDKEKSEPSLRHAYPAFPSSQDTAHTLLHALEHLELKATGAPDELPPWILAALEARHLEVPELVTSPAVARLAKPALMRRAANELRDWVPLVLTLLSEDERRRLVANVAPEHWPLATGAAAPARTTDKTEMELQAERHAKALEPHTRDGHTENNYEQLVRYLDDRGHLNAAGRAALVAAFAVDRKAEKLTDLAPGCGGFLIQFAVDLQQQLDEGERTSAMLDEDGVIFDKATLHEKGNEKAFYEIIGSHSLMSKDTTSSVPFFDDAVVLASVASSSVFTILLQQVAAPTADRRLAWDQVLHHLIRFPPRTPGWERQSLNLFAPERKIPSMADLPELAEVVRRSMRPASPGKPATPVTPGRKSKREELEGLYARLETQLREYRYP